MQIDFPHYIEKHWTFESQLGGARRTGSFDISNISQTVLETSYSFLASSKLEFAREPENTFEHRGKNYVEGFPK